MRKTIILAMVILLLIVPFVFAQLTTEAESINKLMQDQNLDRQWSAPTTAQGQRADQRYIRIDNNLYARDLAETPQSPDPYQPLRRWDSSTSQWRIVTRTEERDVVAEAILNKAEGGEWVAGGQFTVDGTTYYDGLDGKLHRGRQPEFSYVSGDVLVRREQAGAPSGYQIVSMKATDEQSNARSSCRAVSQKTYEGILADADTEFSNLNERMIEYINNENYKQAGNMFDDLILASVSDAQRSYAFALLASVRQAEGDTEAARQLSLNAYEYDNDRFISQFSENAANKDSPINKYAALALGSVDYSQLSDENRQKAYLALETALQSGDEELQIAAARALANINTDNAANILDTALQEGTIGTRVIQQAGIPITPSGATATTVPAAAPPTTVPAVTAPTGTIPAAQIAASAQQTSNAANSAYVSALQKYLELLKKKAAGQAVPDAEFQVIIADIDKLLKGDSLSEANLRALQTANPELYISLLQRAKELADLRTRLQRETQPSRADPNAGLALSTLNLRNIDLKKGETLTLIVGSTEYRIEDIQFNADKTEAVMWYRDAQGNLKPIKASDLIRQGAQFKSREALRGVTAELKPSQMVVQELDKPVEVMKPKDLKELLGQMLRDGQLPADLTNTRFAVDRNGNVYSAVGQARGTHSGYIRVDGKYYYTRTTQDMMNDLSERFKEEYEEDMENIRYDLRTGQIYTRRNENSRWVRSDIPRIIIDGVGDATSYYGHEIPGNYQNMVQHYDGKQWVYYYFDSGTRRYRELSVNDELRSALERRFGDEWVRENIRGNMSSQEIMREVENRQSNIRFWTTFFEGSEGLLYQTVEDKLNNEVYQYDAEDEIEWLHARFGDPEQWEVNICENDFEDDVPDTMQVGYTEYGPVTTRRIEASKETFPGNQTLYVVSWLESPLQGTSTYFVCYGSCSYCLPVEPDSDGNPTLHTVAAPAIDSRFHTEYMAADFATAALCYTRTVEGETVESGELAVPIVAR